MNILEDFYSPVVLSPEHSYSSSGIYHQIQPTYDLNVSTPWVLGERRRGFCPLVAPSHWLIHPAKTAITA